MAHRRELEDVVVAESLRAKEPKGWSIEIDRVRSSTHLVCTLTNSEGLSRTFLVAKAEGLSTDEIIKTCLHDVVDGSRARRKARTRELQKGTKR